MDTRLSSDGPSPISSPAASVCVFSVGTELWGNAGTELWGTAGRSSGSLRTAISGGRGADGAGEARTQVKTKYGVFQGQTTFRTSLQPQARRGWKRGRKSTNASLQDYIYLGSVALRRKEKQIAHEDSW